MAEEEEEEEDQEEEEGVGDMVVEGLAGLARGFHLGFPPE